MKRYNRSNNYRSMITAKFDSTCAETGKAIKKGEKIIYANGKAYCESSKEFTDYLNWKADEAMVYSY